MSKVGSRTLEKFPNVILERLSEILAYSRTGSEITRFFRSAGYAKFVHNGSAKGGLC